MRRLGRTLVLWVLVLMLPLGSSGCIVLLVSGVPLFGAVNPETGAGLVTTRMTLSPCIAVESDSSSTSFYCTYIVPALPATIALYPFITIEFGSTPFTGIPLLDPLVVQFPSAVTGFAGTYDDGGGNSGNLVIQSGLSCIDTRPGEQLCAEPGQQLVIVDVPPSAQNGTFDFTLSFSVTPAQAVQVKSVVTGKVVLGTQVYYPVIAPCVTSFANVPAVAIPAAATLQGITPALGQVTACEGLFDFRAGSRGAPALGGWARLSLAGLLALVGLFALRRRTRAG